MPVVAAVAAVFAVAVAWKAGIAAGHALWFLVVMAVIGCTALVEHLWHRRQLAIIHEKQCVEIGRYRRVHWGRSWPMYCGHCGAEMHGWPATRVHDDPETSACARYMLDRDALEPKPDSLPMDGWTADVLGSPSPPTQQEGPAPSITER